MPNRKTVLICALIAMGMFGFSFALAPLYNVFCKVTGFSSSLRVAGIQRYATATPPDLSRQITVQFVATNNKELPWDFYPDTTLIDVHPDENIKIVFYAKNNTNKTMTVQAIPSFAPPLAAQYFHKIQCFCFDQQTLKAGESTQMPVVFRVDKKLPKDVRTITLAYTLFDVTADKSLLRKAI